MTAKPEAKPPAKLILLVAALALTLGAVDAAAQEPPPPGAAAAPAPEWDRKRLDRLERNLERMENTLAHARPDRAPPNLIEPDPETLALTARLDELSGRVGDLEQALKHVNAALDSVSIELDKSRKAEAAARADHDALQERLARLEGRLAALEQAAQAAQAPPPGAQAPAAGDATAQTPVADPAGELKSATALLRGGDNEAAGKALEAWLGRYPNAPQAPEAHFLLGEADYAQDRAEAAAREYYLSVKGWPKARWAPTAMVRLAAALDSQHQEKQACAAVAEFGKRYAKEAAAGLKAQASAIKARAKCAS